MIRGLTLSVRAPTSSYPTPTSGKGSRAGGWIGQQWPLIELNTCVYVAQSLSRMQLFVTPWTAAHQACVWSLCKNPQVLGLESFQVGGHVKIRAGCFAQIIWKSLPFPHTLPDASISHGVSWVIFFHNNKPVVEEVKCFSEFCDYCHKLMQKWLLEVSIGSQSVRSIGEDLSLHLASEVERKVVL